MIKKEEVYKIGLFNKPHGIHGELQFTFTDDIFDRVDCDYLICLLDGIFVPFFIEEYRFRSDSTALVKLEGIDTAERARMFTNIEVYFPVKHAEEAEDGELSWNFFIGFQMEDPDNWEFVVPAKLKQLYQTKDFGRYAMPDGEMPVEHPLLY